MEQQKKYPLADGVRDAYKRGEEDEAMLPIVLEDGSGKPVGRINSGDYVIFYDIRGEREVQITECFTDPEFSNFKIPKGHLAKFVTMIEYDPKLDVKIAFPPEEQLTNSLCEVVTKAGKKVAKIVETEKAVHLSFFLNGKAHEPFDGEKRCFVESLKVDDYGEHPLMEIDKVTATVTKELSDSDNDLVIANFANTDVIGHIENRDSVITAVEAVDRGAGLVVDAARAQGMDVFITADHGTVEKWLYPDGNVDTGHTDSPVPFIFIPADSSNGVPVNNTFSDVKGSLIDIAPTVLNMLDLPCPKEMEGKRLFTEYAPNKNKRAFLLICDGWGYNPSTEGNLIAAAATPNMDRYMSEYPAVLLHASGEYVGMPEGSVGNSESGHLHIGTGRSVYSDRLKIDRSLEDKTFFKNEAFLWAMNQAKVNNKPLHLLGIVSFYSSHGSLHHLFELMKMAKENNVPELYIHGLLGRRGERPEAGASYIEDVEKEAEKLGLGQVVTVMGRYWALDREYNWDRIEKTYRSLVLGEGNRTSSDS